VTLYITAGSTWENGDNEIFIGSLCDELLKGEISYSLAEARVLIKAWRAFQHRPPALQPGIPTTGTRNSDTAISGLRFRLTPPPSGYGGDRINALTHRSVRPVGVDHLSVLNLLQLPSNFSLLPSPRKNVREMATESMSDTIAHFKLSLFAA
jgi:hypothetical protein